MLTCDICRQEFGDVEALQQHKNNRECPNRVEEEEVCSVVALSMNNENYVNSCRGVKDEGKLKINMYRLKKKDALRKKLKILNKMYEIETKDSGRQYNVKTSCVTYQLIVDNISKFGLELGIQPKK